MQSLQEQLIQEIRNTPSSLLQQILDFVRFLNQGYQKPISNSGEEWPPGFFEEVIGGWEGEKLTREPQPNYTLREEMK
jgi:hypothetical protein